MTKHSKLKSTALALLPSKVSVQVRHNKKRKQNRVSRRSRRNAPTGGRGMSNSNPNASLTSYTNTINDPFMYPGIKLGFGTMVDTGIATAYIKQTFAVATDGSFGVILQPTIGSGVAQKGFMYTNTSITTASWTQIDFANGGAIAQLSSEGRVISGALRVQPLQALTAAPGILYAGHINSCANNNATSATVNSLANFTSSHMGVGPNGAIACIHPLDPTSFAFQAATISTSSTNVNYSSQSVYVVGTGFVAGTNIFVEGVLNIEYITGLNDNYTNAIIDGAQEIPGANQTQTLSQSFGSLEQMWSAAKTYLHPGAIMSATLEYINGGSPGDVLGAGLRAFNSHGASRRAQRHIDRDGNLFMVEEAD